MQAKCVNCLKDFTVTITIQIDRGLCLLLLRNAPPSSNLNKSWVDQVAVVEFRWRAFVRLGQWEDKTYCRFRLVNFSLPPFTVSKQTTAAISRAKHRASNSISPKTDVNGFFFAAAFFGQVVGRRRVVKRWNGDKRHFPRLCHLTLAVH